MSSFASLNNPPCMLSISDVCHRYRISRATVYRLLADQKLKAKKVGNRVLLSLSDLDAWEQELPTADFRPPRPKKPLKTG
jgi:excisionase family DNA binding protein